MSSNLETVERGFRAFNEGGIDGILPFIHPDFEATAPPDLASEPDTYRGHEGVLRWFDSARGKTTGLDFGQDAVMVWELRDGQAIRLSLYPNDQALSAIEQESRPGDG